MTAEIDLVNRALVEIASRQPIASLTDNIQGVYANTIYTAAVSTLLRQQDWEFSRFVAALALQTGTAPLQWTYQYQYPSDCLRVRQIVPAAWDIYDPQPVRWDVGDITVSATPTRVIWTNEASARIVYTTSNVSPDTMDAMFQESLVRYIGSILVMGIAGRPDFSEKLLIQAGGITQSGRDRDS